MTSTDRGYLVSYLVIKIIAVRRSADTSLTKELQAMKAHFSDFLGIKLTRLVASEKPEVSDRFIFARREIYEAAYAKDNHNNPYISFVALGDKDWYVFAYLISPLEQENLPVWGHNVRSFDIVVKSMR